MTGFKKKRKMTGFTVVCHHSAYGKIATNRDKVMKSFAFAIFEIVKSTKKFETKKFILVDFALSKNQYFGRKFDRVRPKEVIIASKLLKTGGRTSGGL
jgi:hypothetical protein